MAPRAQTSESMFLFNSIEHVQKTSDIQTYLYSEAGLMIQQMQYHKKVICEKESDKSCNHIAGYLKYLKRHGSSRVAIFPQVVGKLVVN